MKPELAQSFSVGSAPLRFAIPRAAGEWGAEAGWREAGRTEQWSGWCRVWSQRRTAGRPQEFFSGDRIMRSWHLGISKAHGRKVGMRWSFRFLPTQTVQWFYWQVKMFIVASMEFVEEEQAGRSVRFVGWSFSFPLTFCFPAKQNCMIKFQRGSWRINQVFFSCWCSGWGYKWGSNSPYHCCVSALNIPQKSRAVSARVLLWQSQNNPTVSGQGDLPPQATPYFLNLGFSGGNFKVWLCSEKKLEGL